MRRTILMVLRLAAVCFFVFLLAERNNPSVSQASADPGHALLQVDRDFDKATAEKGVEGWVSYFAEDGMMFRDSGEIVKGKAAIRELMAPLLSKPGTTLRWGPIAGELCSTGDLGYTYGSYLLKSTDQQGKPVTVGGKYVTIWKKHPGGDWKAVIDIGTPGAPPPPSQ